VLLLLLLSRINNRRYMDGMACSHVHLRQIFQPQNQHFGSIDMFIGHNELSLNYSAPLALDPIEIKSQI
jgi:hypothetical protein